MSLQIGVDYGAYFIVDVSGGPDEIVMADDVRYTSTGSTMSFSRSGNSLNLDVNGIFQERPIETGWNRRADLYISVQSRTRILRWLHANLNPALIPLADMPVGPDPRAFGGGVFIPLTGVPSTEFRIDSESAQIPHWNITGLTQRTFLDVEVDRQFHGEQYHLGLRFTHAQARRTATTLLSLYPVRGQMVLANRAISIFYSYVHHYP